MDDEGDLSQPGSVFGRHFKQWPLLRTRTERSRCFACEAPARPGYFLCARHTAELAHVRLPNEWDEPRIPHPRLRFHPADFRGLRLPIALIPFTVFINYGGLVGRDGEPTDARYNAQLARTRRPRMIELPNGEAVAVPANMYFVALTRMPARDLVTICCYVPPRFNIQAALDTSSFAWK
jgi:hypothetical protein